jgi:hypothetical protein
MFYSIEKKSYSSVPFNLSGCHDNLTKLDCLANSFSFLLISFDIKAFEFFSTYGYRECARTVKNMLIT